MAAILSFSYNTTACVFLIAGRLMSRPLPRLAFVFACFERETVALFLISRVLMFSFFPLRATMRFMSCKGTPENVRSSMLAHD